MTPTAGPRLRRQRSPMRQRKLVPMNDRRLPLPAPEPEPQMSDPADVVGIDVARLLLRRHLFAEAFANQL